MIYMLHIVIRHRTSSLPAAAHLKTRERTACDESEAIPIETRCNGTFAPTDSPKVQPPKCSLRCAPTQTGFV